MAAIPNGLTRDQFELALHRLNPAYEYRFLDDGSYEWRGPGEQPADNAITNAWAAYQAAQQTAADAASAHALAIRLDSPVADLEAARDALATARTALTSAVTTLNSTDTQIQGLGASPTVANLTAAVKGLSAGSRNVVAAQVAVDIAIVDGLQALAGAIAALKTRFD